MINVINDAIGHFKIRRGEGEGLETFQKPSPFRGEGGKGEGGVGVATALAGLPVSSSRHGWPLGCAEVASEQRNKYTIPAGTHTPPPFDNRTSDTRPAHPLSGNNAIAWYAKASASRRRHLAHLKHGGVDVSGIDRPKSIRAATLRSGVEQARPGSEGELYVDYSTGNYCLSRI